MPSLSEYVSDRVSRLSIRTRLVLYILIGLIPILLVTAYFFRESYIARQRQVLLGHMATAQATAGAVQQFIEGIVRAQDVISITIARENMSYDEMNSYFLEAQKEIPILETLGFADPSGKIVAGQPSALIGKSVADRAYFSEIASGEDWAVSNLLQRFPAGEPALVVAQRVHRGDTFVGVLFSAISPSTLQGFVSTRASADVGYGILDARGSIIVTTILPRALAELNRDRSWMPSVRQALRGKPAFAAPFRDRADGVWRMGASVPVSGAGWVVNIFEPVQTAMRPVRRAALLDLAADVVLVVLLLLIAWGIGAKISKPITSLAANAEAVGKGDFSQRVETQDQAEIGTLADAFNEMTSQLSRAREEARIARERAVFLADIGELLVSTMDPNAMLQTVAERTSLFIGDAVLICKLDPRGALIPVSLHARDEAVARLARQVMAERPIRVGSGVVGKAVEQGGTIFVPLVSKLADPEMRYYLDKANAVSSIAVPMKVHGQIIGALSVSSIKAPLSEDQVPIVEELARRIGAALENIGLYEDTLEREGFQKGLAELATSVGSSLDPSVVLSEVCRQTRELLDADAVYIWMLDEERGDLVGAAACGFKANEFVEMRLPITEGDTGAVQAIKRKEGFFLHEMPSWRDFGPLLTQKFEVQSAIFVPLISGGEALGTMVITDTQDPKRFDEDSLARAGVLAGYAATALANAGSYQRERRIAETLQRGLLPTIPDTVPGFELAHFYTPALEEAAIGGDFYDFIEVGGGKYGLSIGDVSGKGLEAAVITAMAKYLLRAYTAEDAEPSVVIERTNNALVKYTEAELFITLVYGLLNTKTRRFRYGSAGHEPALVYRAREHAAAYESPAGTAAGLIADETYLTEECVFSPGDMMILYTDGLTDARSPEGGFFGHDALAEMVVDLAGKPASEFLAALMDRVSAYTGGEFADDIAILVVRAMPE